MSKQTVRATPKRDRQRSPGSAGQGPDQQGNKKSGVRQKTAVDSPRAGALSRAAPLFTLARPVQTKTVIGEAHDRYEEEADAVANRISSGRPVPSVSRLGSTGTAGLAQRADVDEEAEEDLVQTKRVQRRTILGHSESGMEAMADQVTRNPPAGTSLPPAMRHKLETGLDTDLSAVRVHQGGSAETAAQQLQARAFTHQNHIWLGAGESVHDVGLMAHEATHVVQQGAAPAPQTSAISRAPARVQRLPRIIGEFLNDYAQDIPGYNLFTVIIGYNPLLGQRVARTAINLVQGLLGLLGPIGNYIFAKLQELNILQPAFAWVSEQLKRLDLSLSRLERTVEAAYDEMRLHYGFRRNLEIARRHFSRLYNDVVTFVQTLVNQILAMIKEAAIGVAEELLAENRAWALTKKVIRYDPLRGENVDASTVEILEDFLLLIGKETELAQMRERGTLQETADWLDTQWDVFSGLLGQLRNLIAAAWNAIQPENLPNLITNLRALASQAFGFIQQVWDFALTIALKVLELVKNALLGWLSDVVHELPGFHLLTVILGRNPFTQENVPRTPENIIRGFITLLPGGNAQYQQLEETGTIGQTAARIEGAMNELGISWSFIVGLFTGIWDSLSIQDLVQPVAAFQRIREQFGEPVARLFAFVRVVITEIFKLVLEMMNFPSDLIGSIISNAMAAFGSIRSNPVGFLLNMLAAVKLGFSSFFDNILQHLVGGLVDWLFRGLRQAGIQPPTDLSLASILDLVLQILGLTMDRIWQKVAERIGQENVDRIRGAMDRLVGIWTFIRDVQERGIAAIWEYIQSQISGLWNMVLEQARNWIMERIINRAIQWLLSLLDPTGIMPAINSFIAFFNAVQSAIEYMRDILAIINDYVSTLAAVARGALEAGAQKLEQGVANAIPIVIGFLANQFGLGNIGEKMAEIVGGIRSLIDRALDWLIDQAERAWQGLMGMLGFGGDEGEQSIETPESARVKTESLGEVGRRLHNVERAEQIPIVLQAVEATYRPLGLHSLTLEQNGLTGIAVVARASEPQRRTITWDEVLNDSGTSDYQAAQRAFASSKEPGREGERNAPTVVAMVTVNGQAMGPPLWNIPGGPHAEDRAIADQWPLALDRVQAMVNQQRHVRVVFAISATPCGRCASNLQRIMREANASLSEQGRQYAEFILAPRSLYEGSYMPHEGQEPTGTATSAQSLVALSDLGWDIRQFAARDDQHASRRYWDQPLAEYAHYLWRRAQIQSST
jgi:hypothetical protein